VDLLNQRVFATLDIDAIQDLLLHNQMEQIRPLDNLAMMEVSAHKVLMSNKIALQEHTMEILHRLLSHTRIANRAPQVITAQVLPAQR
jgi:hypothetical protein